MSSARDERGFVLVSAIMIMLAVVGFGLGLLLVTNGQQRAATREQTNEAAFELAEAALNAQITQLANKWPGSASASAEYPTQGCTETTSPPNGCPESASLSTEAGYPAASTACPAGTSGDAWGSPLSNRWTTYVRDDKTGATYFNSTTEKGELTWNQAENGGTPNGKMWVRAVGVAQCHAVTLVTLVSQQYVSANFPRNTMTANWFKVDNKGKGSEEVIDTRGKASEPGNISMRCNGFKTHAECEEFREGQIVTNTTNAPPSPSPTLSTEQLEALKKQAEWAGTYYPAGSCPGTKGSSLPAGKVVYVEGPCNVGLGGNEVVNSEASPGLLIIVNGTFSMTGTSQFYGEVYDANHQESNEAVVEITGNASLHGGVNVDGNGGIKVGQSHKKNLEFNPTEAENVVTYAGVSPTRNSFRILPAGQ